MPEPSRKRDEGSGYQLTLYTGMVQLQAHESGH